MVALAALAAVIAASAALVPVTPTPGWVVVRPEPAGTTAGAALPAPCGWLAPVTAPVVDGFRPPDHPFGPGNRGIEYGTTAGDPVRAVADGRVTFVGPVGGRRWLVITHDDGLRSSYGPLIASSVAVGQTVTAGDGIAEADTGLHLTARAGERYLDPAPLLAGSCGRARLVAPPGPSGRG